MLMKKLSIVFLLLGITITAVAQKPAWTDYYKRAEMYPENEFLVGYISGNNVEDKESGELKLVYESMAKDKVVQSIQVEIETNNSLEISNINGSSGEEFLSKSVSFSNADVAGLTTQSYYDRRKKEVFAIAFVNKKELAFYYRNKIKSGQEDIEQKLNQGKSYAKKGKKELALKSFYEAMPILMTIDKARTLLIAMNRKMYADINMDEINKLRFDINSEIVKLINPSELNLSETSYFMAYGLFLQLGKVDGDIYMHDFTYENTGLVSKFSQKINQEFVSALIEAGDYNVKSANFIRSQINITGNYWKEGDYIKIIVSATRNEKLIAVSKGSLPLSWLQNENIDFLPEQIHSMIALDGCTIIIKEAPSKLKLGMPSTTPIAIELIKNSHGINQPVQGVPIEIINSETGESLCNGVTSIDGISLCYLPVINNAGAVLKLIANIKLDNYLSINEGSLYHTIATIQNPVLGMEIALNTEKPTVYIVSKELLQGRSMDIKTLEPVVKETLADYGYNFVDSDIDADYMINLEANTTTGSSYEGIYFAFLDANLSVVNNILKEEIFKTHLDQVKGGGSNYAKAGKKAYIIAASKLKETLKNSILVK